MTDDDNNNQRRKLSPINFFCLYWLFFFVLFPSKVLEDYSFATLPALDVLHLHNNKLVELNNETFNETYYIRYITLYNNALETIPGTFEKNMTRGRSHDSSASYPPGYIRPLAPPFLLLWIRKNICKHVYDRVDYSGPEPVGLQLQTRRTHGLGGRLAREARGGRWHHGHGELGEGREGFSNLSKLPEDQFPPSF